MLAASSAAFLLFGVALLYAETGTLQLADIAGRLTLQADASHVVLLGATVLIITVPHPRDGVSPQ